MLATRGTGTDLSAMLVATSCGSLSFLGGLEAQGLPSQRAQRNSWLLVKCDKGELHGLGTLLHDVLENMQGKYYRYMHMAYCSLLTLKELQVSVTLNS